ncbi:MAG: hypothetical protein A3C36_00075 [Omnitrophica WOR_2 bacterium RIFCSPHIGHO2_02_FULL_52_10]|nr:MAG: hypothetical protein A3C36_00075 [Omnitrophica WOR_2 bacterium RIFCSPHIGHO2_02_FULL_52_10]
MKTIFLTYFAYLKDQSGIDQETIKTAANTLGELYGEIQVKYGIGLAVKDIKVAVNDHFTSLEERLCHGDRVVFIPPIAGG